MQINRYGFLSLSLFMAASGAHAGIDSFSSPKVTKGKADIEYSGVRTGDDSGSSKNNAQEHEVELEYGLTDDWKIGLVYEAERESPDNFSTSGVGLELQYEMTEQQSGWWLSSAVKGEYVLATDSGKPDAAKAKLLLQREDGPWKLLANFEAKRGVGPGRSSSVGVGTHLQGSYYASKLISPGLEWHADHGSVRDLEFGDRTGQYIGPIAQGTFYDTSSGKLGYVAGYYWGITDAAADNGARLELKYSMLF